jgi:hypothetical protein
MELIYLNSSPQFWGKFTSLDNLLQSTTVSLSAVLRDHAFGKYQCLFVHNFTQYRQSSVIECAVNQDLLSPPFSTSYLWSQILSTRPIQSLIAPFWYRLDKPTSLSPWRTEGLTFQTATADTFQYTRTFRYVGLSIQRRRDTSLFTSKDVRIAEQ